MFKNFIRAKISTHTLMVALGGLAFAAHHFFADPHAAEWLRTHWELKDAFDTVEATLMLYGVYHAPTAASDADKPQSE